MNHLVVGAAVLCGGADVVAFSDSTGLLSFENHLGLQASENSRKIKLLEICLLSEKYNIYELTELPQWLGIQQKTSFSRSRI